MRWFKAALAATVGVLLGAPATTLAFPITQPLGLDPGDAYRLIFVTSTTRDATSSDIADYNAFVTAAASSSAALGSLGTTWAALASTETAAARDNTGTNPHVTPGVPIYDLAGQRIALDNASMWDGSLDGPVIVDENGGYQSSRFVWTGTDPWEGSGVVPAVPLGSFMGESSYGLTDPDAGWPTGPGWVAWDIGANDVQRHFYAVSDVLIVVPEPSTVGLAAFGLTALAAGRRRRRAG